jgi:1-acyl-sn-glycerol-3-phosphate acyltransferase
MNALRSIVFNFFYITGSLVISLFMLWTVYLPPKRCVEITGTVYSDYIVFITRWIMGIKLDIRGMENLPKDGNFIIAAKHQSAFETLTIPFMKIFSFPAIVLKIELTRIPLWGRYPMAMGQIPIIRGSGTEALSVIISGCRKALADGRNIIIFPQGTRVKPGDKAPMKPGLAKLYKDLQVTVVPMALNTGVFWGKNAFFKTPGTAVFEFLPPIPPGQPPLKMMAQMEEALETASDRLAAEARAEIEKNPE